VDRETTVARNRVEDAETAIQQEQEDMRHADKVGLTATNPETTFEEMLNAIRDSMSHLANFEDGEDGADKDDDDDDPEPVEVSADDEPGWVMGTISKTVLHRMEHFQQKWINLDELM